MFSPARFHSKIKPAGRAPAFACPVCGRTVQMQLFSSFELFKVLEIPVHSFNNRYFAVCPECASVFEPAANAAAAFENGNASFLTAEHFTLLKKGAACATGGSAL